MRIPSRKLMENVSLLNGNGLTKRAPDAGDAQRSRAWAGRCSLDAHSPNLRQTFFWLDGFAVPALVVELVETQRGYPAKSMRGGPQTVRRLPCKIEFSDNFRF